MMTTIQDAVDLNNASVPMICCGDKNDRAVSALSTSLGIMKRYISSCHSRQENNSPPKRGRRRINTSHCQKRVYPAEEDQRDTPAVLPTVKVMEDLQSPDFFIYNRCMQLITVTTHGDIAPHVSTKNLPLYSACIILNLAMVHHRFAIQDSIPPPERFVSLFKAEQLYRNVLQLLPSLSRPSFLSFSTRETAVSMKIVVLNNLAALYRLGCSLGFSSTSEDAFTVVTRRLQSVFLFYTKEREVDGGIFLSDLDTKRIALNIEIWGAPSSSCGTDSSTELTTLPEWP